MRVACLSEISEAAPHNSASRFGERFFAKARFEKRRNTVCISSFSNRRIGGKDPPKRADAIVQGCLNTGLKKLKSRGWANPSPAGNQNDQCRNRDTINTPMMDTTPMTSVPSVCVL